MIIQENKNTAVKPETTPVKEEKEPKEQPDEKKKILPDKEVPSQKSGEEKKESPLSFPIFLILLMVGFMKDGIEVLIGLIPGVDVFSWVFSLPFALIITFIILFLGLRSTWLLVGQVIDILPFASIIPITTVSIIAIYVIEKSPRLKKTAKVATKVIPSTKTISSNVPKNVTTQI